MCVPSQYFADSLVLTAIAPLALQDAAQRLDYLGNRCATLARPSLSGLRGGDPCGQPLVYGLPPKGGQQQPQPHNVRRFRLSDDFLSDCKATTPVVMGVGTHSKQGCDAAVGAKGTPDATSPQRDSRGAGRWSSSAQADSLDWALLLETAFAVYRDLGDGCSERTYQKRLYYDLYCIGVPCIIERPVHTTTQHGMTLGKGRVDLEVARRFLLELKVTLPTEKNVRKDRRQLLRYLTTYQEQELQIERAALVYFANNEVRVVEVSTAPRARNTFV